MAKKPAYEEEERRVKELEKESAEGKQSNEQLGEAKEELGIIFDGIRDGIALLDMTGKIIKINKRLVEVGGYSEEESIGKRFKLLKMFPAKSITKMLSAFTKVVSGQKVPPFEVVAHTKKGEKKILEIRSFLLRKQGKAVGVVVGMRDCTDRKRAEEALRKAHGEPEQRVEARTAELMKVNDQLKLEIKNRKRAEEVLRESEEKYRTSHAHLTALLENTDDYILISDRKGFPVMFNSAYTRIMKKALGIDMKPGVQPHKLLPDKKAIAWWDNLYRRVLSGEKFREVYSHEFDKGDIRHFEVSYHPIMENDEVTGFTELTRDITERKQAEEALRDSEKRYKVLFESAGDDIYVHDFDGKMVDSNQAHCDLLGYTREEFLQMKLTDFVSPENAALLPERLKMIQDLGHKVFESTHIRRDGARLPVETNNRVIEYRGKPAVLAIIRDISERKRMEDEQKKLQAQLQRAQKMEAVGALAGGVAHDLNNILTGLVSYPDLLLMEVPEDSPLRNPILTIQKSGQKAATIVQDLQTLARRGVAVTEVVNLNDIISDYLESPEHERLISFHRNFQFKTELETELLNIVGSPAHLSKTVMNLVSNAAEAMPEGGEISISTENQYIDRPVTGYDHVEEGDYSVLRVSDTGVGISKMDRERIFEPFYTKKVMGRSGTGWGMTVVWGTVKDHKGYIDVKSTKGKGTTFTLYFPVTRKELAKDKSLVSIEDYMAKGESVLVIDDVKEQREIASKILKNLGYSVTSVSSGEEAVDYLKENSADLLVLDMIMDPGIDGYETYKRILEFHPKQKAIIVSGFAETKRVKEAQRLGAGAYVKKPFLLQKIGLAVRDELER